METEEKAASGNGESKLLSMLPVNQGDLVEMSEEEELNLPLYNFNMNSQIVEILDSGEDYYIELRRARRDEHESKEYIGRTIRTTRRVNNEQHISTQPGYTKGVIALAKMTATRIKGYDEDPDAWLFADYIVRAADPELIGKRKSEIRLGDLNRDIKKSIITAIEDIPPHHVKKAGEEYFGGTFNLVRPKGRRIVTKGVSREWCVVQQVGVVELPDGTKTLPTNVVRYFFSDATEDQVTLFDSKAVLGPTVMLEGGDQYEERYVSVETLDKLFDNSIKRIQGGGIDGTPFSISDKDHLKAIDFNIKRSVSLLYFNGLSVETGNSSRRSKDGSSNASAPSET